MIKINDALLLLIYNINYTKSDFFTNIIIWGTTLHIKQENT